MKAAQLPQKLTAFPRAAITRQGYCLSREAFMPWYNSSGYSFDYDSIVMNAPAESGVYAISRGGVWVFFGETGDIRQRLLEHLKGDNPVMAFVKPSHFSFELWPESIRVRRRNELIAEFPTLCNTLQAGRAS